MLLAYCQFSISSKVERQWYGHCLLKDGTWKVVDDAGVVATEIRKNGMYLLKVKESDTVKVAAIARQSRTTMKWHRSLGQLNFTDLLRLSEKLGIQKPYTVPECETCSLAKTAKSHIRKTKVNRKLNQLGRWSAFTQI